MAAPAIEVYRLQLLHGYARHKDRRKSRVRTIGQGVGTNQLVQGIYLSNPGDSGCLVANNIIYGVDDFGIHGYRETVGWHLPQHLGRERPRDPGGQTLPGHNNVAGDNRTDNYDLRATMTPARTTTRSAPAAAPGSGGSRAPPTQGS